MSHEHHHHHHGNHSVADTTVTPTSIPTIATAVVQSVLTTAFTSTTNRMHADGTQQLSPSLHSVQDQVASEHDHSFHGVSSDDHMMMYFHGGVDAIVLFKEWSISSTGGMIGSVIGIFLMALLYEGIKFFREYMFKRYFTSLEYSSVSVLADDGRTVTEVHKVARSRMFSWPHAVQTFLHVIQMVLSYFLMLIFMTYNIWLCLGVVFGAGAGYFLFGWKKSTIVDITEHCH